ncbi:MAG: cytochrome d ubiquinol oxidase subunit II [Bacteroidales bacterium]|jgi:cytochrome d ubiquinol oxidase subunit II|nr:cytochrome d ubiquinol oxidase subunit II [Bacteroidales bacterium]
MFESLSHLALQQYWWVIISLLGSLLVFLMFVQGGQTLIYSLGKNEDERSLIVNSLGRKWEFTFTTLVTFGGAFFASFPLFYSTSFGGAYWVWMLILICFVFQAVSYEFRSKPNNLLGPRVYEFFLLFNGVIGTVLIGTAVGTFFNGSMFSVSDMNTSRWETPYHGLEAAFNLHNLLLGLSVFFLARVLALLYFINNINSNTVVTRAKIRLLPNSIVFVVLFLTFLIWLMFKDGFNYDPVTKIVNMEPHKYLHNLIEMPIVLIMLLVGVIMVLYGIIHSLLSARFIRGVWYAGTGTVLTVLSLFLIAGFNHTCYYPSVFNLQNSLTIENSSSSHYTLTVMSYVSLFVPFVAAYIFWAWRVINKKQISTEELNEESHKY